MKILNGIYNNHQMIDDGIVYTVFEINWLITNKLCKGSEWRKSNGQFRSVGGKATDNGNWLNDLSALSYNVEKALSYLKGKNYINYVKKNNDFKISVTIEGCEVARKLQSNRGRADLWYRENKEGIIWLLVVIITSSIVSIITALIIEKLK